MCTVCTFSYFSYERGWCQQRQIAGVIKLVRGFNLSYLTLKMDAFKKSYAWLMVTEEVFLAYSFPYLSYELRRKSKKCVRFIAELMLSFNLIYLLPKTDANCPIAHVKTYRGNRDSVNRYLSSKSLVSFPHAFCPVRQQPWALLSHVTQCKATVRMCEDLNLGRGYEIYIIFTHLKTQFCCVTSCQPSIYQQFSPKSKIRICKKGR